jgi:hypothetical protein
MRASQTNPEIRHHPLRRGERPPPLSILSHIEAAGVLNIRSGDQGLTRRQHLPQVALHRRRKPIELLHGERRRDNGGASGIQARVQRLRARLPPRRPEQGDSHGGSRTARAQQ